MPKPFLSYIDIENTLEKLRSLISRYASRAQGAFYVMSPPALHRQIDLWRTELPKVAPFYAIKCNPDPTMLEAVFHAGVGFDCASRRELESIRTMAKDSGQASERIIYANPCKSEADLAYAKDVGSPLTVVDSLEELDKLKEYSGGALIRIAVDDRSSRMPFSTKFGAVAERVAPIAYLAKDLGIPIHGISFHVGSSCSGGTPYSDAIRKAYSSLRVVRGAGHRQASILDLGGGYLPDESDFKDKAASIRSAMADASLNDILDSGPGISFIAEPGRFFATRSYDFFVQVIGKKRSAKFWSYTIDDSIYGQFTSILFDHAQPQWVRVGQQGRPRKFSEGVLFGRTCDSVDVIARAQQMEELEVGDWLWFPSMGAYTRATASEFNGFPVPKVFVDSNAQPSIDEMVVPKGIQYMPAVSASSFWACKAGKIDPIPSHWS